MDRIHLIGSEDVGRAGSSMLSAAETMNRAASQMEDTMFRNQRFMEQWLIDLERIMGSAGK